MRYAEFKTWWESEDAKRERDRRARPGRHSPFPMDGSIAPHAISAENFLKELEWLSRYNGHPAWEAACIAAFEEGLVMRCIGARADGKDEVRWSKGFRRHPTLSSEDDPYRRIAPELAKLIEEKGWSERQGAAWAVATYNLPSARANFETAVARLRKELRAMREM